MRWSKVDCRYPITECLFRWRGFFLKYFEINLSQIHFFFPLLLIQIRAEKPAFFPLSCHKPHSFRAFYKVRRYWWILLSAIAIQKLKLTDVDLEGAVKTRSSSL